VVASISLRDRPFEIWGLCHTQDECGNKRQGGVKNDGHARLSQLSESLTRLSLSDKLLPRVPEKLAYLPCLKVLNLNKNCFLDFPAVVLRIRSLVDLRLNDCCVMEVPPSLFDLPNLRYVDLRNNFFDSLTLPISWRVQKSEKTGKSLFHILPSDFVRRPWDRLVLVDPNVTIQSSSKER